MKNKKTYSWVVLVGPFPIRWEEDTKEGRIAAEQYAKYCNRNYQGYYDVKRLADKDTLGVVEKVVNDQNLAAAVRCLI